MTKVHRSNTSGPSPADAPGQQKNAERGQPQAVTAPSTSPREARIEQLSVLCVSEPAWAVGWITQLEDRLAAYEDALRVLRADMADTDLSYHHPDDCRNEWCIRLDLIREEQAADIAEYRSYIAEEGRSI